MDSSKLIVLEQLPVIKQQLELLKRDVERKVADAMALSVTPETYKDVKKVRAELNKEANDWDNRRKEVKNKIMAPYMEFEKVYKDCVADRFQTADEALKGKIGEVESALKAEKQAQVKAFFDEYVAARAQEGYDLKWLTFGRMELKVNMSVSIKALEELVRSFVDEVVGNINMISSHEHGSEIMVEYKKSLDAAQAVTTVAARKTAITEQEKRAQEAAEQRAKALGTQDKVMAVAENTPVVEETGKMCKSADDVLTVEFTVTATRQKLIELREFLRAGGYEYE